MAKLALGLAVTAGLVVLWFVCVFPYEERGHLSYLPLFLRETAMEGAPLLYQGTQSPFNVMDSRTEVRPPLLKLKGYEFYSDPVRMSFEDTAKLLVILEKEGGVKLWGGRKACGNYHPDYAVEWEKEGEVYSALFCFGCREAKFFGPDGYLYADLSEEVFLALSGLFSPYFAK